MKRTRNGVPKAKRARKIKNQLLLGLRDSSLSVLKEISTHPLFDFNLLALVSDFAKRPPRYKFPAKVLDVKKKTTLGVGERSRFVGVLDQFLYVYHNNWRMLKIDKTTLEIVKESERLSVFSVLLEGIAALDVKRRRLLLLDRPNSCVLVLDEELRLQPKIFLARETNKTIFGIYICDDTLFVNFRRGGETEYVSLFHLDDLEKEINLIPIPTCQRLICDNCYLWADGDHRMTRIDIQTKERKVISGDLNNWNKLLLLQGLDSQILMLRYNFSEILLFDKKAQDPTESAKVSASKIKTARIYDGCLYLLHRQDDNYDMILSRIELNFLS